MILAISGRRRGSTLTETLPPPPASYERLDTGVRWMSSYQGTAYGVTADDATWATTTDGLTITRTGVSAVYNNQPVIDLHIDGQGFIIHTTENIGALGQPSGTGRVLIGNTLSTMEDRTPATWTAGTCGRTSTVTRSSAGVILVGQYAYTNSSAYIHRSTDGGLTWTTRDLQAGVDTRHVHAVHFDPADPTVAWATVGDAAGDYGLWRSTDSGDTWASMGLTGLYPIDFIWLSDGTFVGEGEGPHIQTWKAGETAWTYAITAATASAATGMEDWRGTCRCIAHLGGDEIFYATTAEGGAVGSRYGIWTAERVGTTWTPVLLEEVPFQWMIMARTILLANGLILCHYYRIARP